MADEMPPSWFCRLPDLGLLSVGGEDAPKFLQGQTTCDILGLTGHTSILGALCTPQGRVIAVFRAVRTDTAFHWLLPKEAIEAVVKRLRGYVLRSAVTIEDNSSRWVFFGVGGLEFGQTLENRAMPWPKAPGEVVRMSDGFLVNLGSESGARALCVIDAHTAQAFEAKLGEMGCLAVEPSSWRLADIRAGLPQITGETCEAFVPQMLNLDRLGAISFNKGCYTGQEIVARTHYLGNVKRRMYRLGGVVDQLPKAGDALYPAGVDTESVGTVVDAAPAGAERWELLAVLNIQAAETGELRLGSPEGSPLEVLTLPYA